MKSFSNSARENKKKYEKLMNISSFGAKTVLTVHKKSKILAPKYDFNIANFGAKL